MSESAPLEAVEDSQTRSEIREGMRIEWNVPVPMDDGVVLRADVFRPVTEGRYPVILSHGPYGKLLHFEDGYKTAWDSMVANHPDVSAGSSNRYQSWEVADPEKWVPDGYACVRVDSRGCGRSPGYVDHWSARETQDYAACIGWAAQPHANDPGSTRLDRENRRRCQYFGRGRESVCTIVLGPAGRLQLHHGRFGSNVSHRHSGDCLRCR